MEPKKQSGADNNESDWHVYIRIPGFSTHLHLYSI